MLKVEDIWRHFGARDVLKGVSFSLSDGSLCGLIGPSGAGKSVLMKIIGEVLRSHHGSVEYQGISTLEPERHSIGLMFQEGALFDSLNVFDNVAFPLVRGKVPTTLLGRRRRLAVYQDVAAILARVGLSDAMYKMPAQLSGGMRRRVSLARALVSKPKLVLLDDPTAGLDPVASSVIMNLIVELHRENRPITLIISHDLRRLLPVVDNIVGLFDGQIKFYGDLESLKRTSLSFLRAFVSCRYDLNGSSPGLSA